MLGLRICMETNGLAVGSKRVAPEIFILASKNMPLNLVSVLNYIIKVITFIKARALYRLFTSLYEHMEVNIEHCFFTQKPRLYRGKSLKDFFSFDQKV